MAATVTQIPAPRPKGRPTDLAIEHFELAFEHLQCLELDEEKLEHMLAFMHRLRLCSAKVEDELASHLRRMRDVLKPEANRFVTEADRRLTAAKAAR